MQHAIEVDLVAEPLVEVADRGSGVHAQNEPSSGGEWADQGRAIASGIAAPRPRMGRLTVRSPQSRQVVREDPSSMPVA